MKSGAGTRKARGGYSQSFGARLNMPLWARNDHVILHELAHALDQSNSSHGWQFAACLLDLTLYVRGRAEHDKLKAAFKAHRVRFTAPRPKRILTPEQTAANIERLRTYREQRAAKAQR